MDRTSPTVGPLAWALLAALRAYKVVVSPHFAGCCRFLPSCADYAREAILAHGSAYGSWLALRRLARCHPLCAGGHDPVPHGRRSAALPESGLGHSALGVPGDALR